MGHVPSPSRDVAHRGPCGPLDQTSLRKTTRGQDWQHSAGDARIVPVHRVNDMSAESEPLEAFYASGTLTGLIRSGLTLLNARRVRRPSEAKQRRLRLDDLFNRLIYVVLIVIPAFILEIFQRLYTGVTGQPRAFPQGSWQFYLHFGLRADLAHHTNETTGYHAGRPSEASELDDLTAWVMALIQFLWSYEEVMGIVWDEWTQVRLVAQAAGKAGLENEALFKRLERQWEVARPYNAPLNGTYADVRRAAFEAFIQPRMNALPAHWRQSVEAEYKRLAETKREAYQKQMSLLARLVAGRYLDGKIPIPLWEARIGVIVGGQYYLLHATSHDEQDMPIAYGPGGGGRSLRAERGRLIDTDGEELFLRGDQLYRVRDGRWVGFLEMPSVSQIKGQLKKILISRPQGRTQPQSSWIDVLLAETPRWAQKRLRGLLPSKTRLALEQLGFAPIIINWDERPRGLSLAELRRAQRGIGDHALTVMRTESSFVFDQSHVFFDGTWSLAMAEVLTNSAVQWCKRCISIAPSEEVTLPSPLYLEASSAFLKEAQSKREPPEVSAETVIWDISSVFNLREMLAQTGTRLTVNDLLVITRIFHAAHYRPSPAVQAAIDAFSAEARSPVERHAVRAISHSLERGRLINPALLIPVDASPVEPHERIFPITFRNLADNLVWVWDDTWEAYQAYRRIEPPDTPEGLQALKAFILKRTVLIGNLRAFSYILAANKAVAMRGESLNIAILKLLTHLPPWLQRLLNTIPEQFPVLNEIMKGDEVYSNVGRVAPGSSLARFMSAKDDGNTKALVWGVMTDNENRLVVTMRDFRPHVQPLARAGRLDLAYQLAQDYVVSYTADLIGLVARLSAMLKVEMPAGF